MNKKIKKGNIVIVSYRKQWGMFIVSKVINNIALISNQNKSIWINTGLIKRKI